MTLLLSVVATFDVKKVLKGRQGLRNDSHVDIYHMESYLHEDDYEYYFDPGFYDDIITERKNGILNTDPTISLI